MEEEYRRVGDVTMKDGQSCNLAGFDNGGKGLPVQECWLVIEVGKGKEIGPP